MGDMTKNFSRAEFECKCGCGADHISPMLVQMLQAVRDHFERPVKVVSGVRCKKHNTRVHGARNSQHLAGTAADVVIDGIHPRQVAQFVGTIMPGWGGIKAYPRFTHIDVRTGIWRG